MSLGLEIVDLTPAQEQLILALLRSKTKQAAAFSAGINPRTMYRWLHAPDFQAAYRAARRSMFDESLGILERGASAAAQALLDEIASAEGIDSDRSPSIINASMAVLDRAFLAEETITVKEELADMRAELASLKANQQQARKGPPESGPWVQDG